ncbi:MAG: S-layer homology domain-containing protein [Eubacteriales bacterium]|nr:S-layer homology domain-containing protein [Eubacteriales bacterium]
MSKVLKRAQSLVLVFVLFIGLLPTTSLATETGAQFKNGPYLLAPKSTSMVVVWESTKAGTSTIEYGTDKNNLCKPIDVAINDDAPEFQGSKMNLYHYKLDNLKPGETYYYRVKLENGAACEASFRTLSDNPKEIRMITLSDSHIFATRSELNNAVHEFDPDVMLHCGDLVEGTGAQAEQFSFWFQGKEENDFIHQYPVVYSSGNHDQGGIYFDTYVYSIQDKEYGATVEGDSSFNYAGIHIITMNSNPWGLFQMNSEATGNKADQATLGTIDNAMKWLKADLETADAKNADFRMIMMHHPVSDAYTKRYIPDVIEPGNVDLMISGHTHSYARAVSSNPEVGAGTVYLTHQDARTYNKKGDFFYITSTPGSGVMKVENYGATNEGSDSIVANTTMIAKDKQQLEYSNISITPGEVLYNGEITIKATVKNVGKGLAAAVIPVDDNGTVRYLYEFKDGVVQLDPGASVDLEGTLRMESLGKHVLKIANQTAEVNVTYRPTTFDFANIRTKQGDGKISDTDSNVLHIKADVVNIGNDAGTEVAEFKINGKVIDSKKYTLESGESKVAEFTYTFDKAGDYEVTIGNAEPQTISIEGSIQGMPIVKDKSGSGNDAYIHGQPEYGTDTNGKQTLVLDGKRDYIEIPDNGGYTPTDSMTGMVWANLPSGGTVGGVSDLTEPYVDLDGKGAIPDHNPLMVKGIGLGWGTPYMFRMAVRETGKVTYGVCLLDDNGEFSWNDGSDDQFGIKKDTWVQYTSSFSFETGGDSYENDPKQKLHSAHVDKPAFTAPIKTWDGEPLYIGLGFKNTLQTDRNRGMYHTMLPGAISQVRFYTSKLTEDEVNALYDNPMDNTASKENLKIWLDFESKNIVTEGTHTTEWIEATAAPTVLAYDASFSGKAGITATVQTSDDGKTVKEEKQITLTSGTNSIKLSGMSGAKYVRIVTLFKSDLNNTESSVPVLNEYTLTAGSTKTWNTLIDWEKGTFAGAAGHQDSTVYRNYAKDFDDYGEKSAVDDFNDVYADWYTPYINYVYNKGFMVGNGDGTFGTNMNLTRAMLAQILYNRAGKPDVDETPVFTDVPAGKWYSKAVTWAYKTNVVAGVGKGRFAPDQSITRQELAQMLYAAQKSPKVTGKLNFPDAVSVSEWAVDAVLWTTQQGIISGANIGGVNYLLPRDNATRAQAATILTLYDQKF